MSDPKNPAPAATTPPADKAPKATPTKARVLADATIDGKAYKANAVASFDEAVIKSNKEVLDADPAAVKYAESLGKPADDEAPLE